MSSRIAHRSANSLSLHGSSSSTLVQNLKRSAIVAKVDERSYIYSVAFLDDGGEGECIVSCGEEGKIRCLWVTHASEDRDVAPMDAGSPVFGVAVSQGWVVGGTESGLVVVWGVKDAKVNTEFQVKAHNNWVRAIDISADGSKVATGSRDKTVCVWSLSTGQRLLGPWEHVNPVVAVKFSPDRRFLATATWDDGVRIYKIESLQDGHLLVNDTSVQVGSALNQSLAWASDSKQLFVLSGNGNIHCLNVATGTLLSKWSIHSSDHARCIVMAGNGMFIAASAKSSVSFWDTTTHKQVGSVVEHGHTIWCMSISANYHLVAGGDRTITHLGLSHILPSHYIDNAPLHDHDDDPSKKIANLEEYVQELHKKLADSQSTAIQMENSQNEIINSLRADLRGRDESSSSSIATLTSKIACLEKTVQDLRTEYADLKHKADGLAQIRRVHEQKHHCEVLYDKGHITDAAVSLLEIESGVTEDVKADKLIMGWLADFTNQCITRLEMIGDKASESGLKDEALAAYSTILSLGPSTPDTILIKWASITLTRSSADKALHAAAKFKVSRFEVYRVVCDILNKSDRTTEATACFRMMQSELASHENIPAERAQWIFDFQQQCIERLNGLGVVAMDSQNYGEAAGYFSTILSLSHVDRTEFLIKRSKAQALMSSWADALSDADEVIKLDPSSHRGYKRRYAALHGARRYAEAVKAYDMMLLRLEESPAENDGKLRHHYVDARPTIRRIVDQTILAMPRVLIDTSTGHLYDKKRQAEAFQELPIYYELVSSMTTEVDYARIWRVVKEFYRYVMLSHKWEDDEPLLQRVEHVAVYDLESTPANVKLQTFCTLVRTLGIRWAWSDTCCVDKLSNSVLQESLVAMFTWYRGSTLTIIYLRGVSSQVQKSGGLRRSIWNTRAWTYQEYIAAETVQFYTEDWKPYLSLTLYNHKESPIIILEMQQATGGSVQDVTVLRPGLDRVREKLYLASMRQTTLVEDIAYSLLGIFNAAIPVIYGEGSRAVGRLLEHILTGSCDVTILAWTGRTGSYNSCLPIDLTTYKELVPPHIPYPIETAEIDCMVARLLPSLDLDLVVTLYNLLHDLPSPLLVSSRLRLSGIVFHLPELVRTSDPDPMTNLHVYHATTSTFGDIEIKTSDDLNGVNNLCLVHPWIRPLLDQEFSGNAAAFDKTTRALRLLARLRQPFGALLFEPLSRVEYRRVAADSLIMVQIGDDVPLTDLIDNVHTIEVL